MQSFAGVQASYRAALQLSHAQTVTRLYRRSLRLADSWHPHRGAFLDVAAGLRARFDAARALAPESGAARRLLREGEEEAGRWAHPDQYTVPYMPGGTKFMRNPPLPLAVCYPDGLPAGVEDIAPKDVNGIQVPMSAQPQGMQTVLIDAMARKAE
jgi:NADH dehydrogenase (ubiquinone) 1 beta subcomplex subunit 9